MRQALDDIEQLAEMRQRMSEAVDRYWENVARQEEQKYRGRCSYWLSLERF